MIIGMAADLPPVRRALIIKPSSLGDVVTALPVLRALRRVLPGGYIAWLLSAACAPLLEGDADLDEVVIFDRAGLGRAWRSAAAAGLLGRLILRLRRGNFDWALDLQGLLRSGLLARASGAPLRAGFADAREGAWLFYNHRCRPAAPHTVDRNIALARGLGLDARPEDMRLEVPQAGRLFADNFCRQKGLRSGDYLVCVPPTRWATKRYPVRHWRTVVAALKARMPVVLLGGAGDRPLCTAVAEGAGNGAINLAGQTAIPQMVGLIAGSAGVICCDSAAKFIAPAVGVDVVTLMGPTRVEMTGPYLRGRAVVAPVACQGCLRRRCRHTTCMEAIAPETVVAAVEQMLSDRK